LFFTATGLSGTAPAADDCNASSLDSVPGKPWSISYGWRYDTSQNPDPATRAAENLENRKAAYSLLVNKSSPWPDWFQPSVSILPIGTVFQMAMSKGQRDDQLVGFGTFDEVLSVSDVREYLAVLKAWKPDIDRVNRYRVIEVLPVHVGPIGPQIDSDACALLPGRYSQFEMLVPREQRAHYVELIGSHPIAQD
jgi:hypothetical protein